ncbi:MAG: DUF3866 family protein [Actinobacteria bacterium]|nr:DUF3866 family protein [Actinomycetota bacterium]
MLTLRHARVLEVVRTRPGYIEVNVEIDGENGRAISYPALVGEISPGDEVVLNTTAVDVGLGTGGSHYILWNLARRSLEVPAPGHIMKLRYTPLQIKCLAAEERESPHHEVLRDASNIDGLPVIIGTLHSQLPAAAVMLRKLMPEAKIAYIMTDGAALPLALSETVARLKEGNFLDATITIGHAFGGDLEAINIYSGLAAAKYAAEADAAIVSMGPGIVGTGTKLGYTGIEQGQIVNAVNSLGGVAIAVPRISFADKRGRHQGLSHHTITALKIAATTPAVVTFPVVEGAKRSIIEGQVARAEIGRMHRIETLDASETRAALDAAEIRPTTMGRGIEEEPEFFMAAGAAAIFAARILVGDES